MTSVRLATISCCRRSDSRAEPSSGVTLPRWPTTAPASSRTVTERTDAPPGGAVGRRHPYVADKLPAVGHGPAPLSKRGLAVVRMQRVGPSHAGSPLGRNPCHRRPAVVHVHERPVGIGPVDADRQAVVGGVSMRGHTSPAKIVAPPRDLRNPRIHLRGMRAADEGMRPPLEGWAAAIDAWVM